MTTLNGDHCPHCGYAFEVFDRGACPRCLGRPGYRPYADNSAQPAWFSEEAKRFARYYAIWGLLAFGVAEASFHYILSVLR